jgi:hypothetical protein
MHGNLRICGLRAQYFAILGTNMRLLGGFAYKAPKRSKTFLKRLSSLLEYKFADLQFADLRFVDWHA